MPEDENLHSHREESLDSDREPDTEQEYTASRAGGSDRTNTNGGSLRVRILPKRY
jgi:hypothetical protein